MPRSSAAVALLALLLLLLPRSALSIDDPRFTISLLTVGPGATYWERFGHNALLVEDHLAGRRVSYNYGIFDFRQENFLLRFLRGRMLYRLAAFDGAQDIAAYRDAGRRVSLQELNLDPDQSTALVAFLEWNRQPGNADYRYDYFRDNCSTRIRDALDRVLGGALAEKARDRPTVHDYRWHVRRLTAPVPWLYLGTQLGLGRPVDKPISAWESMFLPMELATFIDTMTLADGRPLVRDRRLLSQGSILEPEATPAAWPWFLGAGILLALLVARSRSLALAWWVLSGTLGLILAGLWLGTDHWAAGGNENLLLLSPLAWVAVLVRKHQPRLFLAAAIALAVVAVTALAAHGAGWLGQGNLDILLALTPIQVAALLAFRHDFRRTTSGTGTAGGR